MFFVFFVFCNVYFELILECMLFSFVTSLLVTRRVSVQEIANSSMN